MHDLVNQLATPAGRAIAYPALERAGAAAIPAVLVGMSHADARVRMWCASFMDHHADSRCVDALKAALDDPIAGVRRHAMHSLGCQRCKSDPLCIDVVALLIERATRDPSLRVRRAAVHMLGNQGRDERIAAVLRDAMACERDAKWQRNARWALKQHERQTA